MCQDSHTLVYVVNCIVYKLFQLSAYLHCTWHIENIEVKLFLIVCIEFHVARTQTKFVEVALTE